MRTGSSPGDGAGASFAPLLAEALPGVRPVAAQLLDEWLRTVALWRRGHKLTAARDDRELVDLMVADAAVLAAAIAPGAHVVDVGSGAGAPGLALACLRPDLAVCLVEPMQKRAALLRLTVGKLAQRGEGERIEVMQCRGAEVARRFDVAISRATLPPAQWLALGTTLAPAGQVWVLLAREPAPSLPGWQSEPEQRYRWPLTGAERRAVCFRPSATARS